MALVTINSYYKRHRWPAYTQIPIVVEPDTADTTKCRFKYILDVYVNPNNSTNSPGGAWTKIATLKQYPDPTASTTFDVHRIVQDYMTFRSAPGSLMNMGVELFGDETKRLYNWFRVEAGCEYDDTSSDCTDPVTQHLAEDTHDFIAWNGAAPYEKPPFYFFTEDWFELDGTAKRFLGDFPSDGIPVRGGADYTISCHSFGNTVIDKICFETDNSGGTFKASLAGYGDPSIAGFDMLILGVGPYNANQYTLTSGTQPVVDSDTKYYDVWVEDSSSNRISEKVRLVIDNTCSDDIVYLTWMNRWGAMDSFAWTGSSQRTVATKRTTYERLLDGYRSIGDRSRTVLGTEARDKWKLNSGWVSDSQATWLEQLFTSPVVNIVKWNGVNFEQYPVVVTTTTYEEKTMKRLKLINYSIELEAAWEKPIQRG